MIKPEEVPAIAARLAKEIEALDQPAEELLRRWDRDLHDVYKLMPTDRFVRLYAPWEVNVCTLDITGCDETQLFYSGTDRDGDSAAIVIPRAWVDDPEGFFAEARKEQVVLARAAKRKARDDARKALEAAKRKVDELTEQLEKED